MIRKLFNQSFVALAIVLLSFSGSVSGQSVTTVATKSPSDNYAVVSGTVGGTAYASDFVTVNILNGNQCPISFNSLAMYHTGRDSIFFGGTILRVISTNGAKYDLYGSITNTAGTPFPVTGANGWNLLSTSDTINTDTNDLVVPLFSGLNVVIPPGATLRLLITCPDTMLIPFNTTPLTYTQNGVTLISGSANNIHTGYFAASQPFTAANFTGINSLNFEGRISVTHLPPEPPIADQALKPATRCIGQDLILKATHKETGGIYTWRNSAGAIIAQNTTGTHTITNIDTNDAGKYYVTYRLCDLESVRDSIVLIVNDPVPPTVSGKFDYCLNEPFQPVTVNGTNPKWYYDPTGGSPVPVTPTINTSSPNSYTYYVTQTDAYGCESRIRTAVRFRAAPIPAPPIVNTPIYYCENMDPDELTAIGDTLRWYYFPVGGTPSQIPPVVNTSVNDSFQYYVTQTIDGCESERNRIDVVVTFRPNGKILLNPEVASICADDTIQISYYGSAFDNSAYNWVLPVGANLVDGGFAGSDTLTMVLDSPGVHQIKLRVGQSGCLSDEYSEDITVKPIPYADIVSEQDVCLLQPELIESRKYTPDLDTFIWDFDGGETVHFTTDQGPYGVNWATDGEKIISVTAIHDGCIGTTMDTIMVHPKPSATIVAESAIYNRPDMNLPGTFIYEPYNEGDELCSMDSLKVTVDAIEPGATYNWTPAIYFNNDYSDDPVSFARVRADGNIYVEVEDVYGCINKDSLMVTTKSCCEMWFPNAFTPNNDGTNDLFRPITIGRRIVKTFRVLNRYGQVVYETAMADRGGWDGTVNGKPADIGTYSFLIQFDCEGEMVNQTGDVILIR